MAECHVGGEWHEVTFELLGEAKNLARTLGKKVEALVLTGETVPQVAALGQYGADEIYVVEHPLLRQYTTEGYTGVLSGLIAEGKPDLVLMGATALGRDIAPRVAARLKTGLVAECVALTVNPRGVLEMTHAIYDGNVYSTWVCPEKKPQIVTIRPGVMGKELPDRYRQSRVTPMKVELDARMVRTQVTGFIPADPRTMDIAEADILVAFGRGLGNKDKVALIQELADLLGASVGGSRPAVDNGWLTNERQIGLTGKTASAKLIITFGISGATQFAVGIKDCDFVVAVNTDPAAPIFKVADVSIRCDLHQLLPCLISQLKQSATSPRSGVGMTAT